MGLFDGAPQYNYGQVGGQATNDMVRGLNYFDPYMFLRRPDLVERMLRQDVKDLYSGQADYSKIKGLMPQLAAIDDQYAKGNRQAEYARTTGAGGVGDQDLAREQQVETVNQNTQDAASAKIGTVGDYRREAVAGLENAHQNRFQNALQAGALGLQGKEAALQGYLNSFRPPTGQGTSLFDKIKGIAGVAAAPFTGGASLGLTQGGGGGGGGLGGLFARKAPGSGFDPGAANAGIYAKYGVGGGAKGPNFVQGIMDKFKRPGTSAANGAAAAHVGAAAFSPGGFFGNHANDYGDETAMMGRKAFGMKPSYYQY